MEYSIHKTYMEVMVEWISDEMLQVYPHLEFRASEKDYDLKGEYRLFAKDTRHEAQYMYGINGKIPVHYITISVLPNQCIGWWFSGFTIEYDNPAYFTKNAEGDDVAIVRALLEFGELLSICYGKSVMFASDVRRWQNQHLFQEGGWFAIAEHRNHSSTNMVTIWMLSLHSKFTPKGVDDLKMRWQKEYFAAIKEYERRK